MGGVITGGRGREGERVEGGGREKDGGVSGEREGINTGAQEGKE